MTKVLGIDPGTHRLGWGIIEGSSSRQVSLAAGCIEFEPGTPSSVYLPQIYVQIGELFSLYRPDLLGLETLLFQKNISTAITVAQARGVIILAAAEAHIPVTELAPNSVKLAVAGAGNAAKTEVTRMVGLLLGLDTRKLLDDTADALAVAIAALVTKRKL